MPIDFSISIVVHLKWSWFLNIKFRPVSIIKYNKWFLFRLLPKTNKLMKKKNSSSFIESLATQIQLNIYVFNHYYGQNKMLVVGNLSVAFKYGNHFYLKHFRYFNLSSICDTFVHHINVNQMLKLNLWDRIRFTMAKQFVSKITFSLDPLWVLCAHFSHYKVFKFNKWPQTILWFEFIFMAFIKFTWNFIYGGR